MDNKMTAEQALGQIERMYIHADTLMGLTAIIRQALSAPRVPDNSGLIPIDPRNGRPLITNAMKAQHIGAHTLLTTAVDEDGDEISVRVDVPWDTCKEIYKGMAETAMLAASPEPVAPKPVCVTCDSKRYVETDNNGHIVGCPRCQYDDPVAPIDKLEEVLGSGGEVDEDWIKDHIDCCATNHDQPGPPAPVSIDDKVHAVSLASEVPGHEKRGVIGHYKIHHNGDREGTVLGNWDWERVVADAGLTGKWMVLHFADAADFERDWSMLEATQDSLREHSELLKQRESELADLRAEVEALKAVNAESIIALAEAKSLAASVSMARSRRCEVDGCEYYMQTDEWCRWATTDVLPLITSAIDAARLREGTNQ